MGLASLDPPYKGRLNFFKDNMSSTPNVSLAVLRTLHRLHRQLADLRERDQRGPKQIRANEANIAHREQELAALRDNPRRCASRPTRNNCN